LNTKKFKQNKLRHTNIFLLYVYMSWIYLYLLNFKINPIPYEYELKQFFVALKLEWIELLSNLKVGRYNNII